MDPTKAKEIFLDAVENYACVEWPAYLDRACGTDTQLRNGVELLLAAHQQDVDLIEQGREALKPKPKKTKKKEEAAVTAAD